MAAIEAQLQRGIVAEVLEREACEAHMRAAMFEDGVNHNGSCLKLARSSRRKSGSKNSPTTPANLKLQAGTSLAVSPGSRLSSGRADNEPAVPNRGSCALHTQRHQHVLRAGVLGVGDQGR